MKNIKYKIIILVLIFSIGFNFYQFIQFKNTKNNDIADISYYESKLKTAHNIIDNYEKKINDLTEENKEKNYTSNFKEEEKREDLHPIENKVSNCISKVYSTPDISKCVLDSEKDWEKEIEKNINMLKKIVSNETYASILDSQEKWKEYKKAQEKVIYETIWRLQGTIHINLSHMEDVYITERRAKDLAYILKLMQKSNYIK